MSKDSRIIPVGTILIAIIIGWYIATYRMNAPFQIDQNERDGVTVSQPEFIAQTMRQPKPTMPAPHQVAQNLWKNTFGVKLSSNRSLVYHAGVTLSSTLLGFLMGSSRLAYNAMYPLMTGFNALPKAAFVPILVVWFGIGAGPAILTAFLISFFPIMVNIATGLATLEPELEDVLRVLGAKRWDVLTKVGLPRSMPYFYGSLKVAITLAFVGTTVSEMTAANEGIGYLLISAGSSMQMGLAFSGLVVVGMMAMAMYELFSLIEKRTTAWAHRGSQGH